MNSSKNDDTVIHYLAGPMSNTKDFNYPAFHSAEEELEERGVSVLSAARIKHNDNGVLGSIPWSEYLRTSLIQMLLYTDAIIMLPGWDDSEGAKLERHIAKALGYPVYHYTPGMALIRE